MPSDCVWHERTCGARTPMARADISNFSQDARFIKQFSCEECVLCTIDNIQYWSEQEVSHPLLDKYKINHPKGRENETEVNFLHLI
jgi:Zn ribbon nucleic-acid-binding protein